MGSGVRMHVWCWAGGHGLQRVWEGHGNDGAGELLACLRPHVGIGGLLEASGIGRHCVMCWDLS